MKEWNSSMFIQDISIPESRINMPTPNMEVFGLRESDEDDAYTIPARASNDDFMGEDEEENL